MTFDEFKKGVLKELSYLGLVDIFLHCLGFMISCFSIVDHLVTVIANGSLMIDCNTISFDNDTHDAAHANEPSRYTIRCEEANTLFFKPTVVTTSLGSDDKISNVVTCDMCHRINHDTIKEADHLYENKIVKGADTDDASVEDRSDPHYSFMSNLQGTGMKSCATYFTNVEESGMVGHSTQEMQHPLVSCHLSWEKKVFDAIDHILRNKRKEHIQAEENYHDPHNMGRMPIAKRNKRSQLKQDGDLPQQEMAMGTLGKQHTSTYSFR